MVRRSEGEWREVFKRYEESGKTQAVWCKANGVNYHTFRDRFYIYRKNENVLTEKEKPETETKEMKWIAVENEPVCAQSKIKVTIKNVEIQVDIGYDEQTFNRVCRAIMRLW